MNGDLLKSEAALCSFVAHEAALLDEGQWEQWLALFDRFAPAFCASMTYVVRMVQIDSDKAMPDAERVRQRTFEIARGPE